MHKGRGLRASLESTPNRLAALSLIISAISLAGMFYQAVGTRLPQSQRQTAVVGNSYIGLEKSVQYKKFNTTLPDIINFPLVIGQVDRDKPHDVMADETPYWDSFQGVVIPDKRHVIVKDTVSAVI